MSPYQQARRVNAGAIFVSPSGLRWRYSDRADSAKKAYGHLVDDAGDKLGGSYSEIPAGSVLEKP